MHNNFFIGKGAAYDGVYRYKVGGVSEKLPTIAKDNYEVLFSA